MTKIKENLARIFQAGLMCLVFTTMTACGLKGQLYLPQEQMPTNEQALPQDVDSEAAEQDAQQPN